MILVSAGIKGGSGKTTIAINLSIMRANLERRVLLIDADEQGSACDFSRVRKEELGETHYHIAALYGAAIRSEIEILKEQFDDIIIDVGGRDTTGLRAALTIADKIAVPLLPGSFDIWSLETLTEIIKEAREFNPNLQAYAFINRADAQGRDNQEAMDIVGELEGIDLANCNIGNRKSYRTSVASGHSVTELRPKDYKAIKEINHLFEFFFS